MANKFTIFVVFVAVAQVFFASAAEGSDLGTAQEATRAAWRQWAEVVCKSVRDKWWPIEKARYQYQSHQVAGKMAFLKVAPLTDNPSLLIEVSALSTADRDGIFSAVWDARCCKNYTKTKAAIENYKAQLPYEQVVRDYHKLTKDTGSIAQVVNQVKLVFKALFAEPEKLAEVTCGGGKTIGICPTNEIHEKIDVLVKMIYSWLAKDHHCHPHS